VGSCYTREVLDWTHFVSVNVGVQKIVDCFSRGKHRVER